MKEVWFKRKLEKENRDLAGEDRKDFRALDRGHKEARQIRGPRVYSMAVGAAADFLKSWEVVKEVCCWPS